MGHQLRLLGRAFKALFQEQRDVLAGGIALFAVLSFFPAVGAIVTVYNLVADPSAISGQLEGMRRILPAELVSLISSQLEMAASQSTGRLSLTLVITILLAISSLRASVDGAVSVLSQIVDGDQCRTWIQRQALSLAMGAVALFASVFIVGGVIALPAIAAVVGLENTTRELIEWIRWPAVVALTMIGLAMLYRFSPCSVRLTLRDVWPGALVGSLLWFYVSSLTVLVGALYNAEKTVETR